MTTDDPLRYDGRTILITGGCGELGLPIVQALWDRGAEVLVNDILPHRKARQLLPESDRIAYFRSATEDREQAEALVRSSVEAFGRLPDSVLCHAGSVASHPVETFPVDEFDRIMAANVRSAFLLAQVSASAWKRTSASGHLIFTSSWVAQTPWPGIAPYSASKAAINALMRSFARELAPFAIRANAIAPGIVAAGMALRQWNEETDYRNRASKAIPLGRLQEPSSVADAFLFLCSTMASYMTGSVLTVDGGCSLYPMD